PGAGPPDIVGSSPCFLSHIFCFFSSPLFLPRHPQASLAKSLHPDLGYSKYSVRHSFNHRLAGSTSTNNHTKLERQERNKRLGNDFESYLSHPPSAKMQLTNFLTALLLPLLAVAQPPEGAPGAVGAPGAPGAPGGEPITTVTRTTSQTLTKTVYLTKADTATVVANGTAGFTSVPTLRASSSIVAPPKVTNAGSVMGGSIIAALAGMAVAVLL
ncbi:hypothetical protein B0T18DRAFT_96405, partial [Schizothecium vesticola]